MSSKWLGRKEIALRAKRLRERLGVSQAELAEQLGLTNGQGAISALERGAWRGKGPNAKLLLALCQLAGEDVGYFQGGEPAAEDTERAEMFVAADWMERVAKCLRDEARRPPGGSGSPGADSDTVLASTVRARLAGASKPKRARGER